jgi:Chaperone of endosialidase
MFLRLSFFSSQNHAGFRTTLLMNTLLSTTSIHSWVRRPVLHFVSFLIGCFAFSLGAQDAPVPNPPAPGVLNTRDGQSAMPFVSTGTANSAFGAFALFSTTAANFNTAVGVAALDLNTGDANTAVGVAALLLNTSGTQNTAVGVDALLSNDTGSGHTAVGYRALAQSAALSALTPGGFGPNTAVGSEALSTNTNGNGNTAVGAGALFNNDMGGGNTAIGLGAGSNITGTLNICIGTGVNGAAGENSTIRIGDNLSDTQGASACFVGGIYNQFIDPATDTLVGIDADGKLGTAVPSSRRFKHDIKPMDKASEAILALKPVTFHYKSDAKSTPCFGLIAEEVAEVNPDLVVRNKTGEVWTVRYEQINAMLLNEFLKEHRKVQELEANAARQQKQIEALTAGLQKVSAQLELSKPAPQSVLSTR